MTFSNEELEAKIEFITVVLNELQVAVKQNLASKAQLRQLTLLKQKDIDDLISRVNALELEVNTLKQR